VLIGPFAARARAGTLLHPNRCGESQRSTRSVWWRPRPLRPSWISAGRVLFSVSVTSRLTKLSSAHHATMSGENMVAAQSRVR
jgi:hypothetical protein